MVQVTSRCASGVSTRLVLWRGTIGFAYPEAQELGSGSKFQVVNCDLEALPSP